MANIKDYLESLLGETTGFARKELQDLIAEARADSEIFVRNLGEMAEEFIRLRAEDRLTNDELRELMEDLLDLTRMQKLKLTVQAKTRAERVASGLRDLVLDKLLALI